ncbi:MAG: right-handed parallel beta-helix repeat-containing protein [Patescibacteria group bacterium]|nr:right-handed parallel beta-helix repeat-containing protein [Patescibacteria group bacterium]
MTRTLKLFFFCICAVILFNFSALQSKELSFYVSLSGYDSWSGKLPDPNSAKTDGPFASLARARDVIRELRKNGPFPPDSIIIYIRGGNYTINETFKLTSEDCGYLHAPMVWRAFPGEEVNFIGGKEITGFKPVNDKSVLKRIDKNLHKQILQADLKSLGINDYGSIDPSTGKRMELYFKGKVMEIARYPNEGYLKIVDVPQEEGKPAYEGVLPHKRFDIFVGRHFGKFVYGDDRPKRWAPSDNIWMHGYWTWDWSDGFSRVKKIDLKKREIYIAEPYHNYGYTKAQRYYYLNILEELDAPGEWYLDTANNKLYFYPPEPIEKGSAYFPVLENDMISLEGTSYVTIQGLHFKVSRAGAIKMNGGKNNLIAGCTFTNLGRHAVTIEEGLHNGISGCDT